MQNLFLETKRMSPGETDTWLGWTAALESRRAQSVEPVRV